MSTYASDLRYFALIVVLARIYYQMATENSTSRPVITATNHSAFVFIATALCLVCMLLFLSTRLVVRYPWKRSLGSDDWTTLSASVGPGVRDRGDQTDCLGVRIMPECCFAVKRKSRARKGRIRAFPLSIENSSQSMAPTLYPPMA